MKTLRFTPPVFLVLFLALLSGGCANGPKVDPQVTAAVAAGHVNQETYNKVFHAQALNENDIKALVQGSVPTHIIVGYLRSTQRVYNFTYAQLADLKSAGAKPQLLNYLTETQGFYGNNTSVKSGQKIPKYVRDNSMLEEGKQPFFYNTPMADSWFDSWFDSWDGGCGGCFDGWDDSAYTESYYSPFSFN